MKNNVSIRKILEVCVDSVESAMAAERGGATRLELCSNLLIGGTTPGLPLFGTVRKHTKTEINVLIRPRFGDFLYTEYEFEIITKEVEQFRMAGADGVVVGCLQADGSLDVERMKKLRECAGTMNMTLHRAFDLCKHPMEVLEQAERIGINTILTSGQKNNCYEGRGLIKELLEHSGGKTEILIGGGVTAEVIAKIRQEMPATCFHMSGKQVLQSGMTFRKEGVTMGIAGVSEYELWRTSEQAVRSAKKALFDF